MKKVKWKLINNWESIIYRKFQRIKLNHYQQLNWLSILIKHFKTTNIELKINKEKDCYGSYTEAEYGKSAVIFLDKNSSLGALCHEFAHHLSWTRHCNLKHSQFFIECLKEIYSFIELRMKGDII